MKLEKDSTGTWVAAGNVNGVPFVAEGQTRSEAFCAALLLIKERWGR